MVLLSVPESHFNFDSLHSETVIPWDEFAIIKCISLSF